MFQQSFIFHDLAIFCLSFATARTETCCPVNETVGTVDHVRFSPPYCVSYAGRSKSAFESCNMHAVDTRPRGVHNLKHGERSPHGCPAARIRFCGQLIQALVAQLETDRMCRLLTRNSDNRGKLQRNWNAQYTVCSEGNSVLT